MKLFNNLKGAKASEQQLKAISQEVLLPCAEVEMWLEHLSTVQQNRKRGAAKAAATRRKKKAEPVKQAEKRLLTTADNQNESCKCGVCDEEYEEETLEEELWIECNSCLSWFHGDCVGVFSTNIPEVFVCNFCSST